ncbi:hydantoinase B/oxoprolinase family protein [Ketogulonicigenium vulgare]|uniref:hydantoinase B/oxoprolinase family protein n=1 Tax=Ketogulonicigenium vulgare TaxID=92945 RepID=UPI0003058006
MARDAVALEIISRKLSAVADEMYFAIQRASRSAYVKEAADFATAILDTEGNVFAYPPSATFAFLVDSNYRTLIDAIPDLQPGDVVATNDPYRSGGLATHLPDVNLLRPLFHDGKLVAYAWSFAHFADVGGSVPSSMSPALTEIFQEGLRIPPLKLFRAGQPNEDLFEMIRMNSRVPDMVGADLQFARARYGGRRSAGNGRCAGPGRGASGGIDRSDRPPAVPQLYPRCTGLCRKPRPRCAAPHSRRQL